MRVVGGDSRGRRLVAPTGTGTRPTSDFAREAIFNVLHSVIDVDGATVVDLFCGSGALGIEALSRGAAKATFVDNSRPAVEAVRANLEVLDAYARAAATIVKSEAHSWLAKQPDAVDLAFVDPPYEFGQWARVLPALNATIGVFESDREMDVEAPWEVLKVKRYGGTVVVFAQRQQQEGDA